MLVGAGVVALGVAAIALKVKYSDGIVSGLAADAGAAVVDAAVGVVDGAATGAATAVSKVVGIRAPGETITDANECKAYLDANGWLDASQACSLPAYWSAMRM